MKTCLITKMKRILNLVLCCALVWTMMPGQAMAVYAGAVSDVPEGYTAYDIEAEYPAEGVVNTLSITKSGNYYIYGSGNVTKNRIRIYEGVTANIILHNVNIEIGSSIGSSAIKLDSGAAVTLILDGTNKLVGGGGGIFAAVNVPQGADLTITSISGDGMTAGSLTAECQNGNTNYGLGAAGIGANGKASEEESRATLGNISVNGGTIIATGRNGGAGIGGAGNSVTGSITINGGDIHIGTDVDNKNMSGAGIGSGVYGTIPEINITGGIIDIEETYYGAGIGNGAQSSEPMACGSISISGGTIAISGGGLGGAAGIGNGGAVTITGGSISAPNGVTNPTNGTDSLTLRAFRLTQEADGGTFTQITLSNGSYGAKDVTPANGMVYLYLPEGVTPTGASILVNGQLITTELKVPHTIAFYGNGGTGIMSSVDSYEGHEYTLPENGFTAPVNKAFKCWQIGEVEKYPGDTITVTDDVTVKAVWSDVYTITFAAGGGSGTMTAVKVGDGGQYILPENGFTVPQNKAFKGWKVNNEAGVKAPGETITITSDVTLTAQWSDIRTITFDAGGGSGTMTEVKVGDGGAYTLPENGFTAPADKAFKGWKVNNEDGVKAPGTAITVQSNITLTAQWSDIWTITFDAGGGTGTMTAGKAVHGTKYTLPENGFTAPKAASFTGWQVNGETKKPGDQITVTGPMTVTALWSETCEIEIQIHADGYTDETQYISVAKGSQYTVPAPNQLQDTDAYHYSFDRWFYRAKDASGNWGDVRQVSAGEVLTINSDSILEAFYDAYPIYKVSFDSGDGTGSMNSVSVTAYETNSASGAGRASYRLPDCQFNAPAGKAFVAWKDSKGRFHEAGESITFSSDQTLTAVWYELGKTATVSFNGNGGTGTMDSVTVLCGWYTLPECEFTKTASEFMNWEVNGSGMMKGQKILVLADTEVKALWKESEAAWGSSAENLTNNGNLVTALSAAAAENSTVKYIKLGKNVTKTSNASDYGFTVSGGDFTLDLNGYTISSGSTYSTLYVTNSGTVLTIVDSSGGTGGVKTTYKKYESGSYVGDGTLFRVSNGAQLVIEGGSYEDNDDALVMVGKGSSAVIRGGSFNSDNKGYGYILYNSGTITVEGGTFKALGDDCIINCENDSVTIVKGGAFSEENAYYGAIRYGVGTLDLSQMADPVGLTVYNSTNADVTPSDTTIKLPEGYCFYNTKTQAKAATLIYGTKKDDRHYTLGIDGTAYTITVNSAQNGKVSANKATAGAGMTVTLTLTPDEGYMVDTVTCNDGTQNVTISAVNGVYSFTMPAANVTISAAFKMEHYHNWQYTMVGTDTIKAVCTAAGCDLPDGNGGSVTLAAPAELTYSGSAIKADVTNTFKTGDTVAVVYSGDLTDGYPVNAGNYTASITLGGQTISAEYTIAPASIAGAAVTAAPTAVTYNGQAQKPDVAVSLDEKILTSDDYTVSYSNNTNAGTAKVTVTGKGNYIGTASGTFTIEKADPAVSDFVFTAPTGLTYDGLAKSAGLVPAVSITGMGSITVKYYQGNREVSPVNAGTYTVKIDVAEGANYKPATGLTDDTWTFTIDKAEAVFAAPQAVSGLVYDGSEKTLVTAGSTEHGTMVYSLNGTDWSENIPAAVNAGEYTVSYKVLGDANHKDSEVVSVTVTIARAVPAIGTVNGTIAANETSAAKAVLSRTDDTVAGSLTVDNTEADLVWGKNTVAYTFTPEDTDNYEIVKRETTVTVTDTIAPTGEVKLETNSWKELVNNVTFGLFFNRNVELEVSAADALSGEKTTEYLASAEAMTEDAVKAAEGWQAVGADGKIGITAADAEKYIYYIRITDKAGNTAYLSTDGMVFDLTAPVITGVTDGATYYTTQKVQIADANLADGIEAEQTLSGNVDTTYEVEVADKAGNTAKVTITMKPISILSEVIKDLTSDNVTSDSSDELAAVEDALEAVDTATATEAEKQIIADAKANIDNLQKVIEDAKTAVDNLNEAVTKLNPETITSADKEAVEKLIEEITAKKEDANLTEAQKDQLDKAIADSQEILEKIAADQNALTEALNAVKDITEEDVKEHKTQLEEAKTTLETLLNDDNYTAEEKAAMQEELDRIRELIKTAEKQINYNNIPEVQKPEVETAEGAEVELSSNGTKAEITVKEGYELEDVLVNGKSQGKVTTLTGLKTGDKVQVLVKKMKSAEEILMGELDGIQLTARSKSTKLNGKKAIKIWWYEADGDNTDFFDGYEVFRSVKRYSGFGKKPFFTTEKTSYTNNKNLKSGNTYYYKVRGYVELNGKKYYSDWSRKAWRTL